MIFKIVSNPDGRFKIDLLVENAMLKIFMFDFQIFLQSWWTFLNLFFKRNVMLGILCIIFKTLSNLGVRLLNLFACR